jgi:hypothetical protein
LFSTSPDSARRHDINPQLSLTIVDIYFCSNPTHPLR